MLISLLKFNPYNRDRASAVYRLDSGDMMIDPVCKMEVNERSQFKSSYNGKVYFFCSMACKQRFDRNPAAYVK
jgi:YHS domain-containing protein